MPKLSLLARRCRNLLRHPALPLPRLKWSRHPAASSRTVPVWAGLDNLETRLMLSADPVAAAWLSNLQSNTSSTPAITIQSSDQTDLQRHDFRFAKRMQRKIARFALVNRGNDPVTIRATQLNNTRAFRVAFGEGVTLNRNQPIVIQPGEGIAFRVVFNPRAAQRTAHQANVTFATNDPAAPNLRLRLNGVGLRQTVQPAKRVVITNDMPALTPILPRDNNGARPSPGTPAPAPAPTPTPAPAPSTPRPLTPAADTRVIRVGPNGDVRTFQEAYDRVRDGKPDWILFQRGQTFQLPSASGSWRGWAKSGRSADAPIVIGTFGNGARPIIMTGGGGFLGVRGANHVVLQSLHLYAEQRHPDSPRFNNGVVQKQIEWAMQLNGVRNWVIDDLIIDHFSGMIMYSSQDVTIRNSVIRNSYNPHTLGHSSGLYMRHARNIVIENNVFDHNGWNAKVSNARPSGFNHDLYVHDSSHVRIQGNTFSRTAGLSVKIRGDRADIVQNIQVRQNLFMDVPMAIAVSSDPVDGTLSAYVARNVTIQDNVVLNSASHAIIVAQAQQVQVRGNYIVGKKPNSEPWARPVSIESMTRQVTVIGNTGRDWPNDSGEFIRNRPNNRDNDIDLNARVEVINRHARTLGLSNGQQWLREAQARVGQNGYRAIDVLNNVRRWI